MKNKLRILFTNNSLDTRAGSELVLLDLAMEFRRRGHSPVAYSRTHGKVAEALRKACNLCLPWQEKPPRFSNIRKYVAVGELTCEFVVTSCGIHQNDVAIIRNFVDLNKFKPKEKIARSPKSAVMFDNSVTASSGFAEAVKIACRRAQISRVEIIGKAARNAVDNPETLLTDFDIVFAVGRSALEAMSVGCAVIVANPLGAYGMIQPQNLESRFGRFGITSLEQGRLDPAFLHSEIRKYDAENTLNVALGVREKVGLQAAADHYEAVYREAISDWDENPPGPDAMAERFREAARYIASLKPLIRQDRLKVEILRRQSIISQLKNRGISVQNPG